VVMQHISPPLFFLLVSLDSLGKMLKNFGW
jgi:hypothetical protein